MTKSYVLEVTLVPAFEAGDTRMLRSAMCEMYFDRPELRLRTLDEWCRSISQYLTERTRYEVLAFCDGYLVGATSVAVADDLHVGKTLEVLATYIIPEHRNSTVFRQLFNEQKLIAQIQGCKTLSVSKYQGPYRYSLRYIPIN